MRKLVEIVIRTIAPSRSRNRAIATSGGFRLIGFGLSVVVLAVTSIVTIPAMIHASGDTGWGSIALGQAFGNVGGLVAGYGWGWFGPAKVARASASERRLEYVESVVTRVVLMVPISVIVALLAYAFAPTAPLFAVAGAIQTTSVGLTATWYFVGLSRPYLLLFLDTLPRSVGALAGASMIYGFGASAVSVPLGGFIGMMMGFFFSSFWIMRQARLGGAEPRTRKPLRSILNANRHGVISAFVMASYNSAPIAIVSVAAPQIQPAFALADKIRIQLVTASSPAVSVLQGWVPGAVGPSRLRRARYSLVFGTIAASLLGITTAAFGPVLVNWLSHGEISAPPYTMILIAVWVALSLFQSILERAVLATLGGLGVASVAISFGAGVGLALVYVGASRASLVGVLLGVAVGTLVIILIELVKFARLNSDEGTQLGDLDEG